MENLNERIYKYVLSQSEPVTIGNIASNEQFKDISRRDIGAALIELQKQSALFRTVKNGKAYYSEGEGQGMNPSQQSINYVQNVVNFLESLNALQDEIPTELEIGDTGFDLYKWTFTQGKRQEGNGWSIAIPDGFVVIDSKDCVFEAIPEGMTTENGIPLISILPGVEKASSEISFPHHIHARTGFAAHIATEIAKDMAQLHGMELEITSCAFDDIMAMAEILDTGGASYSYQWSVIGYKIQLIRIQTQAITDKQKKILDQSVLDLIHTFKFDEPNPLYPTEPAISTAKVLNDLIKGDTESFEEAVDSAKAEYGACIGGRMNSLQFMAEYELLDDETPDTVRKILTEGMEVKEFYHLEADKLVEKLKTANVNASIMRKVYNKLKDLEEATTEIKVEDQKIKVAITKKTDEIQKKWKDEAAHFAKLAGEDRPHSKAMNVELAKRNAELSEKALEFIDSVGRAIIASELMAIDGINSTSKAASLLNSLVEKGRVEKFTEKGHTYYKRSEYATSSCNYTAAKTQKTDYNAKTRTAEINEKLADEVYAWMREGQTYGASALLSFESINSVSKATAILSTLVNQGRVERITESGHAYFRKNPSANKSPNNTETVTDLVKLNEELSEKIVEFINSKGRPIKASELLEIDGIDSTAKASSLLKSLVEKGRVKRITEKGVNYFKTGNAATRKKSLKNDEKVSASMKKETKQIKDKNYSAEEKAKKKKALESEIAALKETISNTPTQRKWDAWGVLMIIAGVLIFCLSIDIGYAEIWEYIVAVIAVVFGILDIFFKMPSKQEIEMNRKIVNEAKKKLAKKEAELKKIVN